MIAWLVASGADMWGQCPVVSRVISVEPGIAWCTKAPTSRGAMTSWVQSSTSVGTLTFLRSCLVSDRKVVRAKTRAIAGSVAQKLFVSSSPSSGRSAFPMITGAIAAAQPK